MEKRMGFDVAKKILESAFKPLQCNVEYPANRSYIRFQISDKNGKLLGPPKRHLSKAFCTPRRLKFWISQIRSQLEKQGFQLLRWDPPDNLKY
jgi:hypothetical protein